MEKARKNPVVDNGSYLQWEVGWAADPRINLHRAYTDRAYNGIKEVLPWQIFAKAVNTPRGDNHMPSARTVQASEKEHHVGSRQGKGPVLASKGSLPEPETLCHFGPRQR
jgi:hypothetical protein